MSAKHGKTLRRYAEARTAGLPRVAYRNVRRGVARASAIVRRVDPRSTRGVYLALKRRTAHQ